MNLVCSTNIVKRRCIIILSDIYFHLIQKPIYKLSFNSGNNYFLCKGKMRKSEINMIGVGNKIIIEKGCVLNKVMIEIKGKDNRLIIHKGAKFSEGGRIRIEDIGNTVEIGENTNIINCFLSSADRDTTMKIGDECLFSSDVIIRTSDAHSIVKEGTNERINNGADVIIGEHVWICNGARIMKGTKIGSNCVVGSNTMVAGQQIDDNSLVVGSPAKVVKTGINWSKTRLIKF